MVAPILSLQNLYLSFGAAPLFEDLTLHIGRDDRVCILGRNGTGKSTLMKVIAGLVEPDSGEYQIKPGTTVSYLAQEPDISGYKSLRDYVVAGLGSELEDEAYRADVLIDGLGIMSDADPQSASGGEVRRAALARALITEPDLLLLDEPTNHLDIGAILWLEEELKSRRGALVIISHDRAFLNALTAACLWLDRGQIRRFDGSFDRFDAWQDAFFENERLEMHKLNKRIAQEARWAVEGISARRKRNQGRVRRLKDLRQERRDFIASPGQVKMALKTQAGSGTRVIEAKDIAISFEGRTLFSDFSTRIIKGDRIGIIGPNGAGKTTLLSILLGMQEPDSGSVKLGTNLKHLIIDQKRAGLLPDLTVADVLTGGRGDYVHTYDGQAVHVMSYLKDFLFDASQAKTPVSALSGGERGRLLLAKGFASPANLIVLDEPTNDLDMETLDLLVDVLASYSGTLLVISHDRDFLDRVVTSTIVLEGDGTAAEYVGGYSDYMFQKKSSDTISGANTVKPKIKNSGKVIQLNTDGVQKRKAVKLSYKDQRALDSLPAEIEELSGKIQLLEAEISDPELYRKNAERFNQATRELDKFRQDLDDKEMRWLELAELKESLEKGEKR